MRRSLDVLKLYKQVFQIIFLFVLLGRICINVLIPAKGCWNYQFNKEKYIVTDAEIVQIERYPVIDCLLGEIVRTTVLYQIEDNVYTSQVYSLKEGKSGDRLRIAVKSSDYYKVSVCTLEPAIFKEVKYKIMMLLAIYIVCIICFNILIYGMKRIIEKMDYRTYEVLDAEKRYKQGIVQDEKKEKQQKILTKMKKVEIDKEIFYNFDTIQHLYNIAVNDDYIWCIVNISEHSLRNIGLLPLEGENSVVSETTRLREMGLPTEYCVIGKRNNYFCQGQNSSRVYCFSTNLGITNTTYEDVYDYILENFCLEGNVNSGIE